MWYTPDKLYIPEPIVAYDLSKTVTAYIIEGDATYELIFDPDKDKESIQLKCDSTTINMNKDVALKLSDVIKQFLKLI